MKMDRAAVSENYDAIRESISLWDKDGRLPESMPERDVVDINRIETYHLVRHRN